MGQSLLERAVALAGGPEGLVKKIGAEAVQDLLRSWEAVARPEQRTSRAKDKTLWLCGRGWGKTLALTGALHHWVESGKCGRIAVVAPTSSDVRDTLVEGPAGFMAWAPAHRPLPEYKPSKRRIEFWNGARAFLFSAEEPARFKGPNFDGALCDELAAWKRLQDTWDMLNFCVRIGERPQWAIGTTPRPLPLIKQLQKDPNYHVVRGNTYVNAKNLARSFLEEIRSRYEGTRLGRQEIHAEILDDNPGALWQQAQIEALRVRAAPELRRVAVAVDPAVSAHAESDQTGIISGGVGLCRCKPTGPEMHAFILGNRTGIYTPRGWAEAVITEYQAQQASRVLAEINQGGDLVQANLEANGGGNLPYTAVRATRGSVLRAEPAAALYEQGKVHHVGNLATLEDHMTQWNPMEDSHCPDDVAALVYLLTELMIGGEPVGYRKPSRPLLPRRV